MRACFREGLAVSGYFEKLQTPKILQKYLEPKNGVRTPGIEPGSHPWQGCILPLNHVRSYERGGNFDLITFNSWRGEFFGPPCIWNSIYYYKKSVCNTRNIIIIILVVQPGRLRRPVSLANREAVLHIFDVRCPLTLQSAQIISDELDIS